MQGKTNATAKNRDVEKNIVSAITWESPVVPFVIARIAKMAKKVLQIRSQKGKNDEYYIMHIYILIEK